MKNFNEKLAKFFKWMEESGGEGKDPVYIVPTISLFELYRMEDGNVEPLTDEEIKYLKLKQEALVFQKGLKGTIKGDISKLNLANDFGWSERTKQQDDGPVDYVSWDFDGLLKENTTNHDNESFENEAITKEIGGTK